MQPTGNFFYFLLLEPANAAFANTLGVAHYRLGRWQQAIDALQKSIDLQKRQATAGDLYPLAMAHHKLGQQQQAKEYLERLRRLPRPAQEKNVYNREPDFLRELEDTLAK